MHTRLLPMKTISVRLLALSLLWSLVEVHSQTEYPYISFMGQNLPNHSYVDLTLVRDSNRDAGNTVKCHTDLSTCCRNAHGPNYGDWYFPDGDVLSFAYLYSDDISQRRGHQLISLLRRNNANSPSGMYRCDIPTIAVHEEDPDGEEEDFSVRETVYVGLYASGGMYTHHNVIIVQLQRNII